MALQLPGRAAYLSTAAWTSLGPHPASSQTSSKSSFSLGEVAQDTASLDSSGLATASMSAWSMTPRQSLVSGLGVTEYSPFPESLLDLV